ncbi:MAG: putative metal-binding motif-containing protein [Thermodesulfobacteriota bacterium]|nr:putative metal-binding motif-containing protein [Thermodesulfobacteriota bacterium]
MKKPLKCQGWQVLRYSCVIMISLLGLFSIIATGGGGGGGSSSGDSQGLCDQVTVHVTPTGRGTDVTCPNFAPVTKTDIQYNALGLVDSYHYDCGDYSGDVVHTYNTLRMITDFSYTVNGVTCSNPVMDNDQDGYTESEGDCDDDEPFVNPGEQEICDDFLDNDCDGATDCADSECSSDTACLGCTDGDSDGYYGQTGCGTPVDCNDNDSSINPGAEDIPGDGVDQDCDGTDATSSCANIGGTWVQSTVLLVDLLEGGMWYSDMMRYQAQVDVVQRGCNVDWTITTRTGYQMKRSGTVKNNAVTLSGEAVGPGFDEVAESLPGIRDVTTTRDTHSGTGEVLLGRIINYDGSGHHEVEYYDEYFGRRVTASALIYETSQLKKGSLGFQTAQPAPPAHASFEADPNDPLDPEEVILKTLEAMY